MGGIGPTSPNSCSQGGTRCAPWFGVRTSAAEALRRLGAEVVQGDLTDLAVDAPRHRRLRADLFRNVCLAGIHLEATINTASVARHHGVELS